MQVIGIDLSGPAGTGRTGVASFRLHEGALEFCRCECDGSDSALLEMVLSSAHRGRVVVGIDAPLSYEPGGRQRCRDADLRDQVVSRGMKPGTIMAPTAPRMVYLTLRGIVLARALTATRAPFPVEIVETHPGAAMCLRGAPLDAILSFASADSARSQLLPWFATQGLRSIEAPLPCSSHFVAACAAALAAWRWSCGDPAWVARAAYPWHPYDFSC